MTPTLLEHTEALKDVILDHLNHEIKFHAYRPGYVSPFAKEPQYRDVCIECKTCGNMILWSYETWKEISMEE